jgi:hypothetical protein
MEAMRAATRIQMSGSPICHSSTPGTRSMTTQSSPDAPQCGPMANGRSSSR